MADDQLSPAPARVDLRPLTTSELVDRGFTLYRANFAGLLLLALLCQIAPLVSQVLMSALKLNIMQPEFLEQPALIPLRGAASLGIILVTQVVVFCFEVVMTFYIADAYLGKVPSVKQSLQRFMGCIGASISTCLLNVLLIVVTQILPVVVLMGAYIYQLVRPSQSFLSFLVFGAIVGLLVLASLIPLLVVFMRLMVTIPAVALDGLSGWKAIRRSFVLVRYDPGLGIFYWGEMRLSFLLLPLFVIELMVLSLTSLPYTLHRFGELVRNGATTQLVPPADFTVIISIVLTFVAVSLILPLYAIATTLFYYDVRIRREGFDLEFMAGRMEKPS